MPHAIVAGHGTFAAGITSAVSLITGIGDSLIPFSNSERSKESIENGLRELLTEHGVKVIFTDLPSGSVTIAARRIAREFDGLKIVTGVNLPALIDFVLNTSSANVEEAVQHAIARGQTGLMLMKVN